MSGAAWSTSGTWTSVSKLFLMLVMMLGRLRGLPETIDPSVGLGSWTWLQKTRHRLRIGPGSDDDQLDARARRSVSMPSSMGGRLMRAFSN
mmetsp:Transcript_114425/g.369851  ORF Transcript_114425/g.369851 Transcript_114425/m.369851 type:complete len:91 (-) Transcript_114425:266-538(-)